MPNKSLRVRQPNPLHFFTLRLKFYFDSFTEILNTLRFWHYTWFQTCVRNIPNNTNTITGCVNQIKRGIIDVFKQCQWISLKASREIINPYSILRVLKNLCVNKSKKAVPTQNLSRPPQPNNRPPKTAIPKKGYLRFTVLCCSLCVASKKAILDTCCLCVARV